jgi:hypothetical protein
MNSTAFLFLANNSPEVDKNQEMELTIGSLSFYVGPSGSTRLSYPVKSGPSTSKIKTIAISGSSVGSFSEVNSPVSFAATENTQKRIEEFNVIREEPDIEGTLDISYGSQRDFATGSSGVSRSIHQLYVIIIKAAEENDHAGNAKIDAQVDNSRSNGKKEKEKNPRLHRGVENHHVSHQSQHGSTHQFKKRSSDGVSIRTISTQKEIEEGKKRVQEKSRKQQRVKWSILGRI